MELVPKLLVIPKVTKIKRLTPEELCEAKASGGRNNNSPWHNYNGFKFGKNLKNRD